MIEKPPLFGQPSPVPNQPPVLPDDPVAGNQDGEMVGRDEPPDLTRVESGGSRDILIRPGFAERDFPERLEDGYLGGGEIEPPLEVVGVGKEPAGSCEVLVEPLGGRQAGSLADVKLGHRSAQANGPLDRRRSMGKLDDQRSRLAFDDGKGADRRAVGRPLYVHGISENNGRTWIKLSRDRRGGHASPQALLPVHSYMATPQTLVVRTFTDRAEGLSHFVLRAGEAPRLLAFDDALGCPVETALAALEWTGAVGILLDDDMLHAARLTSETAAAVVERKGQENRRYVYLGPRLDAPPMDVFEGAILFDEPGVKAVEFPHRAHALAHFLRATNGAGALLALLGRRAPEIRHLRRWFGPIMQELDVPRPLVAGWFAASAAGCLFGSLEPEPTYRYIEVGLES